MLIEKYSSEEIKTVSLEGMKNIVFADSPSEDYLYGCGDNLDTNTVSIFRMGSDDLRL